MNKLSASIATEGLLQAPAPSRALTLAEETRKVMRIYHVSPKEQLGQHFLVDQEALQSITRVAALKAGDQVLEIGPGIGVLTRALAQTGAAVRAVELDAAMYRIASARTQHLPNVVVQEGNILHCDLATIIDPNQPFSVVANIPYYITAPILRLFLEGRHRPSSLLLMVQREVGERLAALPGKMSILAVFTQIHADVKVMRQVPPSSFLPAPKVASAVVHISVRPEPLVPVEEQEYLFRVVRAGFGSKRKMLHNALDHGLPNSGAVIDAALSAAGIQRDRRAETVSIEEWRSLAGALREDSQHQPKAR